MLLLSEIKKTLPKQTKVLAVSKLQSLEKIEALYEQGQRHFAENYVQELQQKQKSLGDLEIRWHFIGKLQKNKAKLVVGFVDYIHSVDSLSLAQFINKLAGEKDFQQKIFLQINLANEESKSGFSEQSLIQAWPELKKLTNIEICGLMTMPPLFDDPEQARPYFRQLKNLSLKLSLEVPSLKELSMGTSSDYLIAAQEGATFVRLGTIIFGERPQQI